MVKLRQLIAAAREALGASVLLLAAGLAPSLGSDAPQAASVPAGHFIAGSDASERDYGYQLDEAAYGHDRTRKARWYDGERARGDASTEAFLIMVTPVTNAAYAEFVRDSGHPAPDVDATTWAGYGLVHPFERTRRHAWSGATPPRGRENHPVVLVSHADAEAYAAWLSTKTGQRWRLPSELEWEKAARGGDGRRFPWGDTFDPERLNSHDRGPFDTLPVGSFPMGASPYGVLDMAGQVFEWTATPAAEARYIVKGGSWDDKGCGVCRAAARHSRAAALKHILIGFRRVADVTPASE